MSMQEKECNEMKKKISRRRMLHRLHSRNCVCMSFKEWLKKGRFRIQSEMNEKRSWVVSKHNEKIIVHLRGTNKVARSGIKCQHFLIRFCLIFFANFLCLLPHRASDFSVIVLIVVQRKALKINFLLVCL